MAGFEGVKKWPPANQVRIQKAIKEMKARGVDDDHCPRCHTFDWNVDLLDIPVSSASMASLADFWSPQAIPLPTSPWTQTASALPVLSIICKNCGYTIFHTLNVLESKAR
jgi:hypothetical protein